MALENFTTYAEIDPNSDIAVTPTKCDVSTMRRDVAAYVRSDKGAGYFGDFKHYITVYTGTGVDGAAIFWAVSNGSSTYTDMLEAEDGMAVDICHWSESVVDITLYDFDTGHTDNYALAVPGTPYYCTIMRNGGTLTCKIYSDAGRTILLDTLSIACGTGTYRYIFGVASEGEEPPSASPLTFYTENLILITGEWLYRTPSTARHIEAFVIHNGILYMGRSDDLYRVDGWCEENNELKATVTKMFDLPGAPSGVWSMCTSQGLIWVSIGISLYSYDPDTDTLGGPWAIPILGQLPYIMDIIEYDGDVHILDQCWNSLSVGNEHRIRRFSGGVFTVLAWDAAGVAGQRLEVFQGLLYWACNNKLNTWDGATMATVHSFNYAYPSPTESVGALYNRNNEELYVGIGGIPFFIPGEKPQLYSWDGSTMNFVVTIDPRSAHPRAFAFRASGELYAWCYDGSSRPDIMLVDPVAATSYVDDSASEYNVGKPLIYWPSDDTVWAGHSKTKVFRANPCSVARTYYFQA